jgi:hypothetical protein
MADADGSFSIFLSCGTPSTKEQGDFISAIEAHLKSHGCVPQTVGRSKYSVRQPIQAARECIGSCHGAVVIAFERTRIIRGIERPASPVQQEFENESHPTIWNQMEAAMAYAQDVPILTFVQKGLKRQGMLSNRLEWTPVETDLSLAELTTEKFQQIFREWLALVRKGAGRNQTPDYDLADISIGTLVTLLGKLKAQQMWAILVVVCGMLAGISVASFKVGQAFSTVSKDMQQLAPPSMQRPNLPGSGATQ